MADLTNRQLTWSSIFDLTSMGCAFEENKIWALKRRVTCALRLLGIFLVVARPLRFCYRNNKAYIQAFNQKISAPVHLVVCVSGFCVAFSELLLHLRLRKAVDPGRLPVFFMHALHRPPYSSYLISQPLIEKLKVGLASLKGILIFHGQSK